VTLSAVATLLIAATKMLSQEWLQLAALMATSNSVQFAHDFKQYCNYVVDLTLGQ
jgi:hypothetical protein